MKLLDVFSFFELLQILVFVIKFCKLDEKTAKKMLTYMTYDKYDFLSYNFENWNNTRSLPYVPIKNLKQLIKIRKILIKIYKITNPTCTFLKTNDLPIYLIETIGNDLFILNDIQETCEKKATFSKIEELQKILDSFNISYYKGLINIGFSPLKATFLETYAHYIKIYFINLILFK